MSAEAIDSQQSAIPEQAAPPQAAPPTSRQALVVPRQHPMPVITGAILSAVAGFGLVFAFGWGGRRPPPPPIDEMVAVTPAESSSDDAPPDLLPPPDSLAPVAADRWQSRGNSAAQEGDPSPVGDRYATQPASHDRAVPVQYPAEDRRLSRFSSPDLPPLEPAADSEPPPAVGSPPDDGPTPQTPAAPVAVPEADPVDLADEATTQEPTADATPEPLASATPDPVADVTPEPSDAATDPSTLVTANKAPTADPSPTPPAEPVAPEAASAPADVAHAPPSKPTAFTPPSTAAAAPQPPAARAPIASPPAELPLVDASPAKLAAPEKPSTAIPVGLPTPSPFAAAPPVGPPSTTSPPSFGTPSRMASAGPAFGVPHPSTGPMLAYDDEAANATSSPLMPPPPVDGHAVPGPIQLEGVQTPQVAVEKRGPREIQVGRPARYEIIVRNVGTATAHDVSLRDAVPRGTSLIATTPPAAPAEQASDLVWALGELPPGGETRVIMELMPETEGEIGSIASVSFRADATMRSVATKPALAIDCPTPKPVRIGGDVPVSLTLSNPGTGVATGVVLEGYLPDTVSHRAGRELEFDVGQLRPGETRTIDLVLGTRNPGSTPMRLVARADGGVESTLDVPLEVTAPTLEIAIDMPTRRFLQRPATCTIAMVNSGTAAARSVELAAQLPPGMRFVKANNAGWHDERTHRVLWNLEELPAGETGEVEMVVMPVDAGEQRIMAAARSTDGPSDQAVHSCQVEGLAAVSYQVADSEDPVEVGGVTEYVIRVANEGTKAATGVQVAATLVGDLEPVEASGPGGHRIENLTAIFEPIAKLGAGEEAVYRFRARGVRAGHQRIQVRLVSEDQPTPITKEETTSVYDDR